MTGFIVQGERCGQSCRQPLTKRPDQQNDGEQTTPDATQQILAERGARYGKFSDLSIIDQQLKDVLHSAPNWSKLKPHHKVSLEMITHKISRILNGDPDYIDSWDDIAGYSALGKKPDQ